MEVQVYASILGIPRRCAFDADKPHDLYCAIVKVILAFFPLLLQVLCCGPCSESNAFTNATHNMQEEQEVVYLTSDDPSPSATPPSASLIVAHQWPTPGTPPSLVGGLLYRGYADNTLAGRYCLCFISLSSPVHSSCILGLFLHVCGIGMFVLSIYSYIYMEGSEF